MNQEFKSEFASLKLELEKKWKKEKRKRKTNLGLGPISLVAQLLNAQTNSRRPAMVRAPTCGPY